MQKDRCSINNMNNKNKKPVIVLLDTHALLHRAYHALPDFRSTDGTPTGALYGTITMLLKIIEMFKPEHIIACYDVPKPTYRHEAYEGYKSTRVKTDNELITQIKKSRDIFSAFSIPIYEQEGFEADDVLGTIALTLQKEGEYQTIIASGDMDTMQCIVGNEVMVYTLKKGINDTVLYDEQAVVDRYGFTPQQIPDYKGLRGDPSDNIPGVPGVGEKTATTLITHFHTIENIYKQLHKDEEVLIREGITKRIVGILKDNEEEALFSKMLATIRTDVSLQFSVPNTSWRSGVSLEKIDRLCDELQFRAVGAKVRQLLGTETNSEPVVSTEPPVPEVGEKRIKKAAIALWLLDSDRTNPSYEDIISYGRAKGIGNSFDVIEEALHEALRAHGLLSVYEDIEVPLIEVIDHMEANGITVDKTALEKLSKEFHRELDGLTKDIYTHAGSEFNINSPKQLGEVLFDTLALKPKNAKKTAGGKRSTKESELEKLKADHPIIPLILRYRELQKLVSSYVDAFPELITSDNKIHPHFIQTGTTTGRLACREPNLQNIPTRSEEGRLLRNAFVASPGYTLVSIDYSQVELRSAAILSQDKKLLDIFTRGEDVHTGVAVRVFGVGADEVTKEMRRKAKVINFGILFGMGVNALRTNLGEDTTRQEAQEFLNAYFQTFTRLAEYLEETREFAKKHGYTETLFKRRRYFPMITSKMPHIRAQAERMAINAPIQGTEADVMRIAMNRVYQECVVSSKDEVKILVQVHDELLFEVKTNTVKKHVSKISSVMERVLEDVPQVTIPLTVDVAVGDTWATLEDVA